MELSKEDDLTAVDREKRDRPAEDSVEQRTTNTPERSLVDVLLDFSEEDFSNELKPHENHCYSSLEDSVQSWARVAPLSCIHVNEKKSRKPKKKEATDPTPPSADRTDSPAGRPASSAKQSSECEEGNKSLSLNENNGLWSPITTSSQQSDAPEWNAVNSMLINLEHLSIGEKEEITFQPANQQPHHPSSNCSPLDNRAGKTQKCSHQPSDIMVPIRNFVFLPPIKPPQLSPKISRPLCRGKASEGEILEESCCRMVKKNGRTGSRSDLQAHSSGFSSRHHEIQFNHHAFSAPCGFIPKRYRVSVFSKPEEVHNQGFSVGRSISRTITQPHMHSRCLFS